MEKKMTKREMFYEIIEICEDCEREDLIEFCNHEIDLLDKKANRPTKASETKSILKDCVFAAMETANRKISISELIAEFGETILAPLKNEEGTITSQRVSSYLTKLKKEGYVESEKDKKKTYFFLV